MGSGYWESPGVPRQQADLLKAKLARCAIGPITLYTVVYYGAFALHLTIRLDVKCQASISPQRGLFLREVADIASNTPTIPASSWQTIQRKYRPFFEVPDTAIIISRPFNEEKTQEDADRFWKGPLECLGIHVINQQ